MAEPQTPKLYRIVLMTSAQTVDALASMGFALLVCKGVTATARNAVPLVWRRHEVRTTISAIGWAEQYHAYSSTSLLVDRATVAAGPAAAVARGDTYTIDDAHGKATVSSGGLAAAFILRNHSKVNFTAGLAQSQAVHEPGLICALSLYSQCSEVVTPNNRVLLMFSPRSLAPGTVITRAAGAAVLVDMGDEAMRELRFDLTEGWRWDGGAWAQRVPDGADLVPLLVQHAAH